MHGTKDYLKY